MGATTIDVGNETELNQAIASADAATSGSFDIVFTQGITEGTDVGNSITFGAQTLSAPPDLYALNLASGVSVTIDGLIDLERFPSIWNRSRLLPLRPRGRRGTI